MIISGVKKVVTPNAKTYYKIIVYNDVGDKFGEFDFANSADARVFQKYLARFDKYLTAGRAKKQVDRR